MLAWHWNQREQNRLESYRWGLVSPESIEPVPSWGPNGKGKLVGRRKLVSQHPSECAFELHLSVDLY